MKEEIIMAGFGGQGIMLMGKLLAYAGMKEGYEVSWLPSYGPEMRGGTANCTVILSSDKIPSPMVFKADSILIMNQPSLLKFKTHSKPNGTIYINSSLADLPIDLDTNIISVPATEIANKLGNSKVANMVMLGAYLADRCNLKEDTILKSLEYMLVGKGKDIIDLNRKAFKKGMSLVDKDEKVCINF
ncbi:MAG: 2-oxoacid:acceptor oxidoreductase family protein [Halanaerobiaceae bacterium]